jgi:hypothetical protein
MSVTKIEGNMNKDTRYWLCYDFGFQGPYELLFAWLDKVGATECGENAATFKSDKTREQIIKQLSPIIKKGCTDGGSPITSIQCRIYLISMEQGGRFIFGKRKVAPWHGYAKSTLDSGDEK